MAPSPHLAFVFQQSAPDEENGKRQNQEESVPGTNGQELLSSASAPNLLSMPRRDKWG